MKRDITSVFTLQRNIFGICPESGQLFRLSDCRIFQRKKPDEDWMEQLRCKEARLDAREERLEEKEYELREIAKEKGRKSAQRKVRRIDPVFSPRKLNPDDAKVIMHPVDYVVFNGMKSKQAITNIILLDRKTRNDPLRLKMQKNIEKVISKGNYEWMTLRVGDDGNVKEG